MSPHTVDRKYPVDPCDIAELIRPANKLAKMRRRQFGSLAGLIFLSAVHAAERAPLTGAANAEGHADA
jgi:hypothetical protein